MHGTSGFLELKKNNRCAQIQFFKKIGELNKQAPQAKNFLDLSILEAIFFFHFFLPGWLGYALPTSKLRYCLKYFSKNSSEAWGNELH